MDSFSCILYFKKCLLFCVSWRWWEKEWLWDSRIAIQTSWWVTCSWKHVEKFFFEFWFYNIPQDERAFDTSNSLQIQEVLFSKKYFIQRIREILFLSFMIWQNYVARMKIPDYTSVVKRSSKNLEIMNHKLWSLISNFS